jgi:HK97 gp10 family phage protein
LSEYNDGLTAQLAEYFEELKTIGDKAVEAIKEQIDIEADAVENDLQNNTPEDTGGLKASLRRTSITKGSRYGYRLEYEGNDPSGTPYAKIANIQNNGTSTTKPKRFLTRAVKKLKGLNDRAAKRFEEKLKG